jgi:glutamine amidotransferase
MCRWFAYISPSEECLLEDVLINPAHSLSKQVHAHYLPKLISHVPGEETTQSEISLRNRLNNVDGFGVAWYTPTREAFVSDTSGLRPSSYKHSQPPTNDFNFHSICANTSTTALFAHIRAATATAVTPINNHPFIFGRHTIMHNGVVADFSDIRRDLLGLLDRDAYENIKGTTDSEHMAALYITYLTKSRGGGRQSWEQQYSVSDMKAALTSTFHNIIALQHKLLGRDKVDANSLNVCCTDGSQMIAFRFRNHVDEQPPSLYWSTSAGVTLNRKYPDNHDGAENMNASKKPSEHGNHVIVASEPTTYKPGEWDIIPKNHAVLVDGSGQVKVGEIEVEEGLLATKRSESQG